MLIPSSIPCTPKSHLFGNKRPISPKVFMTEDANEPEEPEIQTTNNSSEAEDEKVDEKRIVLLTIPLFCKFVVVLLLKFATDLIVYPLLFLYRLAGIVKRKFFRLIGRKPEKTNGES